MLVNIIIILVSLALFLYWFRYTCLLILSTRTTKDYAAYVADANQLGFLQARDELTTDATPASLDTLRRSLDRDYRLLTYLLRHAANYRATGHFFEYFVLVIDYNVMRLWYAVARRVWPAQAKQALLEMTSVVGHIANQMGERASASARS